MTPPPREQRTPSRPPTEPDRSATPSDVSMRDLLASCAAASAVSTPPADGAPEGDQEGRDSRGSRASGETGDARNVVANSHAEAEAAADGPSGRRSRTRETKPVPAR